MVSAHSRRPFTVELVGLPGAGKSTVAEGVAARLRARGERVLERMERERVLVERTAGRRLRTRAELAGRSLVATLRRPEVLRFTLALPRPRRSGVRWTFELMRLLEVERLLRRGGYPDVDVRVYDQHVWQLFWTGVTYMRPPGARARLEAAVAGLPLPDLLVSIELEPEESTRRLERRRLQVGSTGDFDGTAQATLERLRVAADHLAAILEVLETERGARVLRLDGAASPEALVEQVCAELPLDPR